MYVDLYNKYYISRIMLYYRISVTREAVHDHGYHMLTLAITYLRTLLQDNKRHKYISIATDARPKDIFSYRSARTTAPKDVHCAAHKYS